MTQGLSRKFLHPRRGSHLHRLHVQFDLQARLSMSPYCLVVMLGAGWRTAAARRRGNENKSERTRLFGEVPRSTEARRIFTMTVAKRGQEEGSVEVCALIHQQLICCLANSSCAECHHDGNRNEEPASRSRASATIN